MIKNQASNGTSSSKFPRSFFVLVFALSIPFEVVGAITGLQLLPGLPVSALGAFCPALAALILVYRERKTAGMIELLKRSFDYQHIKAKIWYAPVLLLMPAVTALVYGLMHLLSWPLPPPQFPGLAAVVLFLIFFVAALGEELGWSGYAIDRLQARWNALQASLFLGAVWAAWHLIPLMQADRSPTWIAWWCLGTVATRVLMVWLYNNTGKSVFAMALYHAMENLCWQLFPSYYDPLLTSLVVAGAAVIVTVVWGPKTLARYRYGRLNQEVQLVNPS